MKASLWLGPGGLCTLRFDDIEFGEIAQIMLPLITQMRPAMIRLKPATRGG